MKQARTTQTKVDLTIPVDPGNFLPNDETDCFGTDDYSPQDHLCATCADIEVCGIKFQEATKKKVKAVEAEHGPMMDQCDIDGVNFKTIERLALKYQDEGEPMTFEELQEVVALQAKTKDSEAVLELIKRNLPLTRIVLQEGVCRVR
jgi:hypothetical protein